MLVIVGNNVGSFLTQKIFPRQCNDAKCMQFIMSTKKRGSCPPPLKNEVFRQAVGAAAAAEAKLCFDMCTGHDFQCPGTQKCCQNECGTMGACVPAHYLSHVPSAILPEIPDNLTVVDISPKVGLIKWQMRYPPGANETVVFVVEMREHCGHRFVEWKMSKWTNVSFNFEWSTASKVMDTKKMQ